MSLSVETTRRLFGNTTSQNTDPVARAVQTFEALVDVFAGRDHLKLPDVIRGNDQAGDGRVVARINLTAAAVAFVSTILQEQNGQNGQTTSTQTQGGTPGSSQQPLSVNLETLTRLAGALNEKRVPDGIRGEISRFTSTYLALARSANRNTSTNLPPQNPA